MQKKKKSLSKYARELKFPLNIVVTQSHTNMYWNFSHCLSVVSRWVYCFLSYIHQGSVNSILNTSRMGLLRCFNKAVCKHLGLCVICLDRVNPVQIKQKNGGCSYLYGWHLSIFDAFVWPIILILTQFKGGWRTFQHELGHQKCSRYVLYLVKCLNGKYVLVCSRAPLGNPTVYIILMAW